MFFIHFNDDILLYNLLYNGSYIHKSIKNFEFWIDFFNSTNFSIKQFLGLFQSNDFLICLDLVFNNIRKFYNFLHDQARESIPYRTGQYGRYIPYRSLKQYRNTCFILVQIPVIPGCSGYTGRNIMLQLKKSYRTRIWLSKQKERKIFRSSISLLFQ